jgi:hypothetical protein
MAIEDDWTILLGDETDSLAAVMAGDLAAFLNERMELRLPVRAAAEAGPKPTRAILLDSRGGGDSGAPGSFTIRVENECVRVQGQNPEGLRDGVVRLVDRMAFRAAPVLTLGEETRTPRLGLRIGTVPRMGSYRDLIFLGYNGVIISPTDNSSATPFHELSSSTAIPEFERLHNPELVRALTEKAHEARRYGLKTFVTFSMWDFYPADDMLFTNHPELRGAEAYYHMDRPPAGHLLCTEAPLMRRYLEESIEGIFKSIPLDGALIIIGGEEFQHCFMRPTGVETKHTNCPRCEKLGAETVVANLCNHLAQAARAPQIRRRCSSPGRTPPSTSGLRTMTRLRSSGTSNREPRCSLRWKRMRRLSRRAISQRPSGTTALTSSVPRNEPSAKLRSARRLASASI